MHRSDRYAHLRANLALHRAVTAAAQQVPWCRSCESHLADDEGLCPFCGPVAAA